MVIFRGGVVVRSHRGGTIPPGCGRSALGGGFHQGQRREFGKMGGEMVSPRSNALHFVKDVAPFSRTGVAVATGRILLPFFP